MLRRQQGQGMVEFALISPVLLMTLLAIIETALIFQGYLTVQHAAREAARWAVTYKPERGTQLDGTPCDGVVCDPNETEEEYWRRRVELIKLVAVEKAVGLRIDEAHLGLTEADFGAFASYPNFYGVQVWGYPRFEEPSGGWQESDLIDHPGIQGLPVRVRVTHNVELLDPLFRAIVPRVRVVAQAEMINEGTQAGYGNVAPPSLPPPPPLPPVLPGEGITGIDFSSDSYQVDEGDGEVVITVVVNPPVSEIVTVNYITSDGSATEGADYHISGGVLTFDPGETTQTFTVEIIDDDIAPPEDGAAETVGLVLSGGNADIGPNNPATLTIFDNDGPEPRVEFRSLTYEANEDDTTAPIDVILTAASGEVIQVDYATADNTAHAGSDYTGVNGTLTFEPGVTRQSFDVPIIDDAVSEGAETVRLTLSNPIYATIGANHPASLVILDNDALPTPTPEGPFITVSEYQVAPDQVILINVNQHQPGLNPYELLWVDASDTVVDVISDTLRVDGDGFRRDIRYTVPSVPTGVYYVETRKVGDTIARSSSLQVVPPPPDLVVRSIGTGTELRADEQVTVTVEVQNLSPGPVSGLFDVDLYIDPDYPPVTNRPGTAKAWMSNIGGGETRVITHVVTLYGGGVHELWAQVDTSDWVPNELNENNNIYGPTLVTARGDECKDENGRVLTDRFAEPDPELDGKWSTTKIGDATVLNTVVDEAEGTLSLEANGSGIWNRPDAGGAFLYQAASGDFVATLKIIQPMSGRSSAKVGLMVRSGTSGSSQWVSVAAAPSAVQFAYRTGRRAQQFSTDMPSGAPVWVRLVRNGDTFTGYYSADGGSWVQGSPGVATADLDDTILIGIVATSASATPATAIVDDFEVCFMNSEVEACQAYSDDFEDDSIIVWSDSDIGATIPGSSSKNNGTMTVLGDGANLWNSDNFHYTYQQVPGDFVATLKINSRPSLQEWSKAGLMVRGGIAQDSAHLMVVSTRDHGLQFGYRAENGDATDRFAADTEDNRLPVWVRISRNGNSLAAYYSTDGSNWVYRGGATVDLPDSVLIGMAVSSYTGSDLGSGNFDDFLFCAGASGDITPPHAPPEDIPPGMKECAQTIELGNFEASFITPPWERNVDAFHASDKKHSGNFSLEFRASVGPPPEYRNTVPWAYQSVAVPGSAAPNTTGQLSFWQFVVPDPNDATPDPGDSFKLVVRDASGITQTAAIPLAQGDDQTDEFVQKVVDVEQYLPGNGFADLAGQDIQIKFYGVNNLQAPGTSFYIDDVRFDICTVQPIPEDIPGTASIGGLVEVLLDARPTKMTGIQVWAFAPGGTLYRTRTIHDSTYHFYNVPPGRYTIYAEVWTDSILYTSTTEVGVIANERNYGVNLLLQ
jgi:regulation of enolase protein 1 (concanavalin A-like superfamily)